MPRGFFELMMCVRSLLALACGADESFHVIEVPLERSPSECRETILRLRHAAFERFRAGDVLRLLELSRVHAEIPVGGVHQLLEIAEAERIIHRQRADDPQPETLVNETIDAIPMGNVRDQGRENGIGIYQLA